MTRRVVLAALASIALLGQAPSLSGSVYRSSGSDTATAVGGALVYVHRADDTGDTWSSPALTDAYGRFTFPMLKPGQYLLRVFVGRQRVWQQVVTVPSVLKPIVLSGAPAPRATGS
jgi:Carboxypeptidase regulatory-like domain